MVYFLLELDIDSIKTIEPDISGNFITALSPNAFLLVESGLVRRKILQMNLGMAVEEKSDFISFVPFSPIHIKMNRITSERFYNMLQYLQKSFPIALRCTYQSFPPQQWCYPTRQIEPLAVLAGGRNFESLTLLSPPSPQARMKAKAGLILKNDGFIGFEVPQFFLTPYENGAHPWSEPVDKHSQPVSGCNLSHAANIAPVSLSASVQTASSDEPPVSVHPKQPVADQIPGGFFPDSAQAVVSMLASVVSNGPVGDPVLEPEFPPDSLHVSSVPESCDLDQTKRLPVPDAGPPKPAIRRRSLSQSKLPGFALPGLVAFPGLHPDALNLKLS